MSARWHEVESWLDRVLDLPTSQARDLLERECGDPSIREEVESLLGAEPDGRDVFDRGLGAVADGLLSGLAQTDGDALLGSVVGRYRLVELLGEGGMGSVYRGERVEGDFQHEVAIKVLREEMKSSRLAERFSREREILATLDHPQIAKLLDGGATSGGLPYFVLELVAEAQPITDYCATHDLDLEARVRMLLSVCDAVQAAHRRMVIHRDLKPSNVLVDGEGLPKLVDFGIAKLTEDHEGEQTTVALLTPLSASPEQMAGEPVGPTSDVYQLGLLLFELVTGQHPHRLGSERAGGLRKAVLTAEIPRPSWTLREGPAVSTNVTGGRPVKPPRVTERELRGDLDAVVLKALEKDPDERYQSVAQFGDELRRWLEGRPVLAQPDSLGYRLRRWAARNRAAAAAIVVASVSLLATAVLSAWFAWSTARQSQAIAQERDLAEEAQNLMSELFQAASPVQSEAMDDPVTALEVLRRGEQRLRDELAGERPELLARMLRSLGQSHQGLGRYERAEALFTEALEQHRALASGSSLDVAVDLTNLAELELERYDYVRAGAYAREALTIFEQLATPEAQTRQTQWVAAFSSIMDEDEPRRADLETMERIRRAEPRVGHLSRLAMAYRRFDEFERAIELYEAALREGGDELRSDPQTLGALLNNLAFARNASGDPQGAVALYEEALQVVGQWLGEGHPRSLMILGNLAAAHAGAGQLQEAVDVLRRRADVTAQYQPGSWRVGDALESLAAALLLAQRYEEALTAGEASYLAYQQAGVAVDAPQVAVLSGLLGLAYLAESRAERGQQFLERFFAVFERSDLETRRRSAQRVENLAEIAEGLGRLELAARFRSSVPD